MNPVRLKINFIIALGSLLFGLLTAPARADILYVANHSGTITKFNPGGVASVFANSGFSSFGLAFDTANNLYVTHEFSDTIDKITPSGVRSVFSTNGVSNEFGVAFDGAGNLYVPNADNGTISKFTPGGVGSVFATGFVRPRGLAFDSAGNLYVADFNGTIKKFTPGGVGSVFASGLSGLEFLAFDRAGNLYVTNAANNTITKFTPGGAGSVFASSALNLPQGVAFDSAGNLYVANTGDNTIVKFTPGGIGSVFASGLSSPIGLAFTDNAGVPLKLPPPSPVTLTGFKGGTVGGADFSGQSFTIPGSGAFTNISFNFLSGADLPRAAGTGFLLSTAYAGTPTALSNATPGYLGSAAATDGFYNFGSTVTLLGGTQYFFYSDTVVTHTRSGSDGYPGGSYYNSSSVITGFANPAGDANFGVSGTAVVSPPPPPGTLTGFTAGVGSGANFVGQSFTIPAPGSFTNISFNFLIGSDTPVAAGTAFLLSTAYAGTAGALSKATPGYLGSATAFGGFYNFGDSVALVGGRQYFLYSDTVFTHTGSSSDGYSGGSYFGAIFASGLFSNFVTPATMVDANFRVAGIAVGVPPLARADILYVSALSSINPIVKVAANGAVTGFAGVGFSIIAGVAFDGGGNLYAADHGLETIVKTDRAGVRSIFASGVGSADGLAFDAVGNLYVSNLTYDTITKITPAGVKSLFADSSSGVHRPTGLAFDRAGNLYIANFQRSTIVKVTPAGVGSVFATDVGSPRGLAFDSAGNLYVANAAGNGSIAKITPAGVTSVFVGSGLGNYPFGVAFDGAGVLHVASLQDGAIRKFSSTGADLGVLATVGGAQYIAFTDSAGVPLPLPPAGVVPPPPPLPPADPGRIVNMSIRSTAGTGAQTLIVGAVIGGAGTIGPKPLLIRGVGPALTGFGVPGALADPVLNVFAGTNVVTSNDNWNGDAQVISVGNAVGAFPLLPVTSRDAALYAPALAARDYTIQITGVGGTTGIALAELYDASTGAFSATTPQLVNVSARAQVGTGADILIAGFSLAGTTSRTLLIRAVGPTLSGFGVPGVLADPQLALFSGDAQLQQNNDWGAAANVAQITATTNQLGTFALTAGSRDSVILTTLPPGSYTAQVSGVGSTTGVALVEIYLVP